MSSGPFRGRTRKGLDRPTRAGSTKPKRAGLRVIPPAAFPTVAAVLKERGWLGVIVVLAVCYLQGTEVTRVTMDEDAAVVFAQGRTRRFPLPPDSAALVRQFLDAFQEETKDMLPERKRRYVAEVLSNDIEPKVQRRLTDNGQLWAKHINVSITSLRRAGIENLLASNFGREYLRAFTRNPRAHPEDLLPPISLQVIEELDEAVAPFWAEVKKRISPRAKAAIGSLANKAH